MRPEHTLARSAAGAQRPNAAAGQPRRQHDNSAASDLPPSQAPSALTRRHKQPAVGGDIAGGGVDVADGVGGADARNGGARDGVLVCAVLGGAAAQRDKRGRVVGSHTQALGGLHADEGQEQADASRRGAAGAPGGGAGQGGAAVSSRRRPAGRHCWVRSTPRARQRRSARFPWSQVAAQGWAPRPAAAHSMMERGMSSTSLERTPRRVTAMKMKPASAAGAQGRGPGVSCAQAGRRGIKLTASHNWLRSRKGGGRRQHCCQSRACPPQNCARRSVGPGNDAACRRQGCAQRPRLTLDEHGRQRLVVGHAASAHEADHGVGAARMG